MSDFDPIPRIFYSEYSGEPFQECVDCGEALAEMQTPYTVVKHFVGDETVFEMAICLKCAMKLREQYSQQTATNLRVHLEEKLRSLQDDLAETGQIDQSAGIGIASLDWCAFCRKSRDDTHRKEIVGLFYGHELIVEPLGEMSFSSPMLLCQDCNSQLSHLISKQTRDAWDRFVEDHFDGPPGIELDDPSMKPALI